MPVTYMPKGAGASGRWNLATAAAVAELKKAPVSTMNSPSTPLIVACDQGPRAPHGHLKVGELAELAVGQRRRRENRARQYNKREQSRAHLHVERV